MRKIIMMVMVMVIGLSMVMGLSIDVGASAYDANDDEETIEYIATYIAEKNDKLADKYGFTYKKLEYYRYNGFRFEVAYYEDVTSVEGLIEIGTDSNYDYEIEKEKYSNTYIIARVGNKWYNMTEIEIFTIDESLNGELWRINPQAKNDDNLIESIKRAF